MRRQRWARWAQVVGLLMLCVLLAAAYVVVRERPHGTPDQQAASVAAHQDREVQVLPVDERPVLVLLHGAGLNRRMWDPVIHQLDPRLRAIALDLPGHGVRQQEVFSLEAARSLVRHVAQRVAPAPVILAGDSLGGYVAMASAATLPREQLRGLVLAGCSANYDPADGPRVWQQLAVSRLTMAVKGEAWLATYALQHFGVAPEVQSAMREAGLRLWAVEEAFDALKPVDFKGLLSQVEQPVLIVNGDGDVNAVKHEAEFLAAARQSSSHRLVHTGHGVSLLRPAEFAALMNAFSQRVLPP